MSGVQAFEALLYLEEPWFISGIEMDVGGEVMHVRIAHRLGVGFDCPRCHKACEVYDHTADRVWRHLDMWQCQTQLHARLPRVRCAEHGVVQVVPPWAEAGSRMSLAFERRIIETLLACQTVIGACRLLRLKWDQVRRVMKSAVTRGLARRSAEPMAYLAVDEKAIAKGHKYATVLYDLAGKRVLELAEDRRKDSLKTLYGGLSEDQRKAIEAVCMDMWEPFVTATCEALPEGEQKIVHDRFHVMQHVGEAVNAVRVQEAKALSKEGDERLKGTRQLWLYSEENLPTKARERFAAVQHADLKTARAWAIKENLRHTWTQPDVAKATEHLTAWCRWALGETLTPITRVALMIKEKFEPIVRYCTHRITTGPAEGINSKLMAVQRQARGHRGFANFRISALFHCGGLSLFPALG
jgi:transposase